MVFLQYYLWIAPHALLLVILALLFWNRWWRQFPFFTGFVMFDALQFVILLAIFLHSPQAKELYDWTLLSTLAIETLLVFAVIYELAGRLLLSHTSLHNILRAVLCGAFAIVLLAAALSSFSLSSISGRRVLNLFEVLDFVSSLILTGLLLTVFALTHILKLNRRRLAWGLALGIGIYSATEFFGAALRSAVGFRSMVPVDILDMSGYHICVLVWLFYLLRFRRPIPPSPKLDVAHADLQLWGEQMQRMVN